MNRVLWRDSNPCTDSLSLDPAHDSIAPLGPNEQRPGTGEGSSTGVMYSSLFPSIKTTGSSIHTAKPWRNAVVLGVGFERVHLPCEGDGSDR